MGWSIGYDRNLKRDVGYGVVAYCDHPGCKRKINRGLAHVCGGDMYGGEFGCGRHFCSDHLYSKTLFFNNPENNTRTEIQSFTLPQLCERCLNHKKPFPIKPDHPEWKRWKKNHPSWLEWRETRSKRRIGRIHG